MINAIIRASLENRAVILLLAALLTAVGVYSYLRTPVDALPDLSDVQVIVRTPYPGPGAAAGRGPGHLSAHDGAAVGAGRDDGARLLVLWRLVRQRAVRGRHGPLLGSVAGTGIPEPGRGAPAGGSAPGAGTRTPPASAGSTSTRSPTASGRHDLAQLRSIQDWFLKYELQALDGVAEVADRRRHGQAVPGRRRPAAPARLRPHADDGRAGHPGTATRKSAGRWSRWPRPSTWCAPPGTCRASRISSASR